MVSPDVEFVAGKVRGSGLNRTDILECTPCAVRGYAIQYDLRYEIRLASNLEKCIVRSEVSRKNEVLLCY